jgi:hypothetical protein
MSRSTRSPSRPRFRNSLLLGLTLLGAAPVAHAQPNPDRSCVDVQVGSARSYDCINRSLRNRVERVRPPQDDSTLTASSPSNRVGTFNQSATREFLGSSFGHSAIPQPHLHTYTPPLGASPRP